jgi:hypothetical protein
MAKWFGSNEETPPELKDMTPAQIVERLKAADLATAKVAELEPRVAEVDTLRTKVTDMETRLAAATRQPEPTRTEPVTKQPTSFLEDENQAFNERMAPYAGVTFAMGEQLARMNFRQSVTDPIDVRIYKKYGSEVEDLMSKEGNPAVRANAAAWQAAFDIIKGRHVRDINENRDEFFSEVATGSSNSGPAKGPDADVLTDDDKKLAKKYGLSDDEWKAQRKEMVIHHG